MTPSAEALQTALATCRTDIQKAIEESIERLNNETGLSPSAIEVDMIDVSTYDRTNFIVGNVRLKLWV